MKVVVLVVAILLTGVAGGLLLWYSHSREEAVQAVYDKAYDVGTLSSRRKVMDCWETEYHTVGRDSLGAPLGEWANEAIWKCRTKIEGDGTETYCWAFPSKDSLGGWEPVFEFTSDTLPLGAGCDAAAAERVDAAIVDSEFR